MIMRGHSQCDNSYLAKLETVERQTSTLMGSDSGTASAASILLETQE